MLGAALVGLLAASSLVVGALAGLVAEVPRRWVGLLLAFGAGALISSVSFELAGEALARGGLVALGAGLALGALTFYAGDRALESPHASRRRAHRPGAVGAAGASAGTVLALGALLDGVPEQAALGIALSGGESANVALLVAIFISNVPEALGSSAQLRADGRSRASVLRLWGTVALAGALATVLGYALLDGAPDALVGGVSGFAAGAILVMLVDSMIPEARELGGRSAGLATIAGYAAAALLSQA